MLSRCMFPIGFLEPERDDVWCGELFEASRKARYCPRCMEVNRQQVAARETVRRILKRARRRAEVRSELRCDSCGEPISQAKRARRGAAYCSTSCRQRAYRQNLRLAAQSVAGPAEWKFALALIRAHRAKAGPFSPSSPR